MFEFLRVLHGGAFPKTSDPNANPATRYTLAWWLQQILGKLTVNGNAELTTHDADALAKLEASRVILASIDGKDLATGAKQEDIKTLLGTLATQTKVEAIRVLLDSINTKDFATQTTLAAAKSALDTLNLKDFATAAKQDALKATLDQVYTAVDQVESYLLTLTGKDYATAAKQDAAKAAIDAVTAAVQALGTTDQPMHLASGPGSASASPLYTSVTNFPEVQPVEVSAGGLGGSPTSPIYVTDGSSPGPIPDDMIVGTLDALNDAVALGPLDGRSSWGLTLVVTDLIGDVTLEGSQDGTNWFEILGVPLNDPGMGSFSVMSLSGVPETRFFGGMLGSVRHVRARVSAYSSGSATAALVASSAPGYGQGTVRLEGPGTSMGNLLYIAGTVGLDQASEGANAVSLGRTHNTSFSMSATGNSQAFDLYGSGTVTMVVSGPYTGLSAQIQLSKDGVNFVSVSSTQNGLQAVNSNLSGASVTGTNAYSMTANCLGYQYARLNVTALTSGAANVTAYGSPQPFYPALGQVDSSGVLKVSYSVSDVSLAFSLSGVGSGNSVAVSQMGSTIVWVVTATNGGSFKFVSEDGMNGATTSLAEVWQIKADGTGALVTQASDPGVYICPMGGRRSVRIICTTYGTGNITGTYYVASNANVTDGAGGFINGQPVGPLNGGWGALGYMASIQTLLTPPSTGTFWPDPTGENYPGIGNGEGGALMVDSNGNLRTRGPVTTDEGSVREDFSGTSLYKTLTGTVAFTNGDATITGTGTAFLSELSVGAYIKLTSHAESALIQVGSILSDTQAVLKDGYAGGTASGTTHISSIATTTGTGGSISVANSKVTVNSGTIANSDTHIWRDVDYGPLVLAAVVDTSQRIANQTGYIGLQDDPAAPLNYARFKLTGTVNTQMTFESAGVNPGQTVAASDIETTTFTIPNGGTTASSDKLRIEILVDRVRAFYDDVMVADHVTHMPGPYSVLGFYAGWQNGSSAPASNSSMNVDVLTVSNVDRLQTMPVTIESEPQDWVMNGNATNATVTLTQPAPPGNMSHYIKSMEGSFSSSTPVILIELKDGAGKTYFSSYTSTNKGPLNFPNPIKIAPGQSAVLTLQPGGNGTVGRANLIGYTK